MSKFGRLFYIISSLARVINAYLLKKPDDASIIIVESFLKLGGVYVKFLQLLALQPRFFSHWRAQEKMDIYDNVTSEPLDIIKYLSEHLNAEQKAKILVVSPDVLAGGSFAQVYRAKLVTGEDVIIKILRPSIIKYLRFDQRTLWVFTKIFKLLGPGSASVNFDEVYKEFKQVTSAETDYKREVYYAGKLYKRYKNHPNIVVPKTYTDLSSDKILVQEYINGLPLTEVLKIKFDGLNADDYVLQKTDSNFPQQLLNLAYDLLYQSFMNNENQGDPHPGNIFLLPHNKVAIIDFGIIGEPPKHRNEFYELIKEFDALYKTGFNPGEFFKKILQFYSNDLYRAIAYMDGLQLEKGEKSLIDELAQNANRSFEKYRYDQSARAYLKNAEIRSLFLQTINANNRLSIDVQIDGGVQQKATNTFMSVLDQLDYKNYIMSKAYEAIIAYIEENGMPPQPAEPNSLEDSMATISSWLNRVADSDPLLFNSIINKQRSVNV